MAELALIPIFALASWKAGWTYCPPEENICVAMAGNYQPDAAGASGTAAASPAAAAVSPANVELTKVCAHALGGGGGGVLERARGQGRGWGWFSVGVGARCLPRAVCDPVPSAHCPRPRARCRPRA